MTENGKYFKIGIFLLIALVVFVLTLVMLGNMKEYLSPKAELMTMVSESV